MKFIEDKLQQKQLVLLDGATGTELEKRGYGKLFSSKGIQLI